MIIDDFITTEVIYHKKTEPSPTTRGQARALFGFGWFAFGVAVENRNATAFKLEN